MKYPSNDLSEYYLNLKVLINVYDVLGLILLHVILLEISNIFLLPKYVRNTIQINITSF